MKAPGPRISGFLLHAITSPRDDLNASFWVVTFSQLHTFIISNCSQKKNDALVFMRRMRIVAPVVTLIFQNFPVGGRLGDKGTGRAVEVLAPHSEVCFHLVWTSPELRASVYVMLHQLSPVEKGSAHCLPDPCGPCTAPAAMEDSGPFARDVAGALGLHNVTLALELLKDEGLLNHPVSPEGECRALVGSQPRASATERGTGRGDSRVLVQPLAWRLLSFPMRGTVSTAPTHASGGWSWGEELGD
eukprot:bmy_20857T0